MEVGKEWEWEWKWEVGETEGEGEGKGANVLGEAARALRRHWQVERMSVL